MKKWLKRLLCRLVGHRFKVNDDLTGYQYVPHPRGMRDPVYMGSIQWWEALQCTRCNAYGRGRKLDKQPAARPFVYTPYTPLFVTKPIEEQS